jgi:putative hydrolase of the HAD superfamily
MHKAILFDLGGVIVPLDAGRAFAEIESLSGLAGSEARARIAGTGLVEKLETGGIEPRAFAAQIGSVLGLELEFDEFCRIWNGIFPPHTLVPDELLIGLRRRYRLFLVSNTNAIHFPFIERNYPVLSQFDDYVLSYQVGAVKPDPAIYREALARAACPAAECLFIDDMADNVAGARLEGIDAVQFESFGQLRQSLTQRGIVF